MTGRWKQGTNDQDGDGHKGGSISAAEAARRAQEQEDNTMAKKPTNTAPKSDAKGAEKAAPSQPWAKPAAKAESAPATDDKGDAPAANADTQNPPANAEVVNPTDSVPSEAHDQMTPTGDPDAAHEQAREEAGGNGGGTPGDVPSELVDQHTPTGPSPEEVDAAAEAGTPDSSPNRVDAEAKDQETPVGEDLSSTLHAQFEELDEDERAEFERHMNEQAKAKLDQLTKGRRARAMAVGLVDGARHYGKRIPQPRRKEVEA